MTSMVDDILGRIPADDLAAQLGTDPETAMDAARKALPALLGGLSSNVSAGGGDSLSSALQRDHDGSLLDRPDPLAAVDAADGQKILGHVFGDQQSQVIETLGATSRGGSSIFSKLLPILAPLVMAALAKRVGGALGGGGGGGLSDLLGGLLGGEVQKGKSSQPDLGGLFDILGGGAPPSSSESDTN